MQTKYTNDGKKVAIVGKLNADQTIVQEIFITENGQEIPSGENFVVTSLHNEPVISWKEKKIKEVEAKYETEISKCEREIEALRKRHREESQKIKEKLNYIGLALKNANEQSFQTLVDYVTGEIKWIVVRDYDIELLPIEQFREMYEDKLRLISLFGKDDGSFTYAVGDYYDFSGGNKKFIPFKNYEDAFERFKSIVQSKDISDKTIESAKKYGFDLDEAKLNEWKSKKVKQLEQNIKDYQAKIQAWEEIKQATQRGN